MPSPTSSLHALLTRQLQRVGLRDVAHAPDDARWVALLAQLSQDYASADAARELAELRSQLEVSKFEAVVNALSEALCVFDRHGSVVYMNPAAKELLACPHSTLSCAHVFERIAFPDSSAPAELLEQLAHSGAGVQSFEGEIVGCGTEPVPVSLNLAPILEGDQVGGSVLTLRDLSESRAAHNALLSAKQHAEDASRAKSEFLATMSHELRTPLNGVLGMVAMLRDTELTVLQREYTDTAFASGEALLSTLAAVLDYSKLGSGDLELEQVDFELDAVIDDVVALHADSAHEAGLDFDCLIADDVPRYLRGDPARLRQVLMNLVSNAVRFTSEGGVRIEVERHTLGWEGTSLRFQVKDTGSGLSPADQQRVFGAFTQADGSVTRRFGGAGLGLAICRRLCWAMGGDIGVVSQPDEGSSFWFTASFEHAESCPAGSAVSDTDVVLLAGADTPRQSLAARLRSLGASVHAVRDETEALQTLESCDKPRCLLVLPIEAQDTPLLDELTRRPGSRPVQVIVTTRSVLPPEALSNVPRFDALLRLPARSRALREILDRLDRSDPDQRPSQPEERAALSILVVDDNLVNQLVARRMLEQLGNDVITASNGVEALNALRLEPVDLVFMDCQMPELDGYAATRMLRNSEPPGTHLPIVAMTANAVRGDREACLAAGMDDFLSKPVHPEELNLMVQRWGRLAQRA